MQYAFDFDAFYYVDYFLEYYVDGRFAIWLQWTNFFKPNILQDSSSNIMNELA